MTSKFITLLAICVIGMSAPLVAAADSIDSKINQATDKIGSFKGQKQDAEKSLAELDAEITDLDNQIKKTLLKKIALEKELKELNSAIESLETAIAKRTDKISEQARSVQIYQGKSRFIDVLLDAENLSDAVTRSLAYSKLALANNEIVIAQKTDKEKLSKKKKAVAEKIVEVSTLTEQFKVKQAMAETNIMIKRFLRKK